MNEPTVEQKEAADRLDVSLQFANTPLTVARLVELVDELRQRVATLEKSKQKGRVWPG